MSYKLNTTVSTNTTFTGTIVLPATTSVGNVSGTELSYVDGVTSSIQTQLNGKQPLDGDLTAIAALAGTSGLLNKTGTDTWALDTTTYAPINSPTFTGTPAAPTAAAGTNTTQVATTAFVSTAIDNVIDGAPAALDTLNELAAAINDDASYASTITTALSNKQPLDADLTAIAALAGTSGLLKKTGTDTWTLDTSTYITGNQSISLSGDVTGSGTTSISTTLANTTVSANSYGSAQGSSIANFTVDAKGRLTAASTVAIGNLPGSAISSGTVSASYIDSAIARLASPTFTGTVTTQGEKKAYVAKTANYTLTATDSIVNATTGTWAATLPTAVGVAGQQYTIKNSGSGTITVGTTSSQTIDGSATQSLVQYESVTVTSDGANWIIV